MAKSVALKTKDPVLTPLLLQNFSADELRQLVTFFESPVKKKFEGLLPELHKTYLEKVAETGKPTIQPKVDQLQKDVGLKMRAAATVWASLPASIRAAASSTMSRAAARSIAASARLQRQP